MCVGFRSAGLIDDAMPRGSPRRYAAVAEDVEVVRAAIEDVNETDSLGRRSGQLDHAAPTALPA